jgi:hypothetical protein
MKDSFHIRSTKSGLVSHFKGIGGKHETSARFMGDVPMKHPSKTMKREGSHFTRSFHAESISFHPVSRFVSTERGVNLISDALPFGRLWYGESNTVRMQSGRRSTTTAHITP